MQRDLPFRGGRGGGQGDRARGRGSDHGRGSDRGRGRGQGDGRLYRGARGDSSGHQGGRGGGGGGGGGPVACFANNGASVLIDGKITDMEDRQVVMFQSSSIKSLPPRPGYGKMGRGIVLWANYFQLTLTKKMNLQRYAIEVKEVNRANEVPAKLGRRVIEIFIEQENLELGVVTDYRSNLLSLQRLTIPPQGYQISYRSEGSQEAAEDARQFIVHLQSTGTLAVSDLLDGISSSQGSSLLGNKQELINALNIVVGHHAKTERTVTSLSNNRHYDTGGASRESYSLGAGLEAIRGFFFSVRASTSRMLVNTQIKSMAFYESGPLTSVADSFLKVNYRGNFDGLRMFLQKVRVEVTHIVRSDKKGNPIPRYKTIQGLATPADGASSANPPKVPKLGAGPAQVKFFLRELTPSSKSAPTPTSSKHGKKPAVGTSSSVGAGRYVSVKEFFTENYSDKVSKIDDRYPVINVGTVQEPSYLPMEVCRVCAGQPARAKLSPDQTKKMIDFTVRNPCVNATAIVNTGAVVLGFKPNNARLTSFGVTIDPHMIPVPGRILAGPTIKYAGQQNPRLMAASWNLQGMKFVRPAKLERWISLVVTLEGQKAPWPNSEKAKMVLDKDLGAKMNAMGIQCAKSREGLMIEVSPDDRKKEIEKSIQQFSAMSPRPELVVVVLPKDATALYNQVKYLCDVKYGLINICMAAEKVPGAPEQYFANVALKINLKLGGANHTLVSQPKIVTQAKTMIVGLDVTHPSPGSAANAPSVAAIVASINSELAQWPAELRIQTSREEMVQALGDLFKSRLRLWREKNKNTLPDNILVYRDGVSEGQYQLVLDHELPAMRKACQEMYPATETKANRPRISIVVVGKRHHTRFYATKDPDRHGNPPNGTIVDRGVTETANWDFFLQAHTSALGTARPAHYFVVHDEIFRNPTARTTEFATAADALENVTHNLCYLCGRATKAVSLCPPAYYADLACERARCYLADAFAPGSKSDSASTSTGGPGTAVDAHTVQLHRDVKDKMFYI